MSKSNVQIHIAVKTVKKAYRDRIGPAVRRFLRLCWKGRDPIRDQMEQDTLRQQEQGDRVLRDYTLNGNRMLQETRVMFPTDPVAIHPSPLSRQECEHILVELLAIIGPQASIPISIDIKQGSRIIQQTVARSRSVVLGRLVNSIRLAIDAIDQDPAPKPSTRQAYTLLKKTLEEL